MIQCNRGIIFAFPAKMNIDVITTVPNFWDTNKSVQ